MSETTFLRRKLPFPSKVQLGFLLALILWSMIPFPRSEKQWHDALFAFLLFGGFALLRLLLDLGYRAWYDEGRIYVRGDGLGWVLGRPKIESIAFTDIDHVQEAFGRDPVLQKRFMPFDHIRIEGDTDGNEGFVMIAPNFLKVEDVRSLLLRIEQQRPEVMSAEVTSFAHSSAAW